MKHQIFPKEIKQNVRKTVKRILILILELKELNYKQWSLTSVVISRKILNEKRIHFLLGKEILWFGTSLAVMTAHENILEIREGSCSKSSV